MVKVLCKHPLYLFIELCKYYLQKQDLVLEFTESNIQYWQKPELFGMSHGTSFSTNSIRCNPILVLENFIWWQENWEGKLIRIYYVRKKSIFNKMRNKETTTFKQNNIKKKLETGTRAITLENCCYWLALPA